MSVLDRIIAHVRARPDAIAVIDRGHPTSYATLARRAQGLAERLAREGIGPEDVVGLHVPKSLDYVAGVLGAWLAGAAFVPLPIEHPRERNAYAVAASRAAIVIGDDALGAARRISPCDAGEAATAPAESPPPERLAYVIFTSGSTGRPKGVRIEHRGLPFLVGAQIAAFELGPESRALLHASIGFDASISDLTTALASGAALVIEDETRLRDPRTLIDVLREREITCFDVPPSLLARLDPERMPAHVRTLVVGGEPSPPALLRSWARTRRVVNVYGPTEATVCASLSVIDPARWDAPMLGAPIPGTRFSIRDAEGAPCSPARNSVPLARADSTSAPLRSGLRYDVPEVARAAVASRRPARIGLPVRRTSDEGELFIAGAGLARDYAGEPELTAARFVVLDGERWLRTGDRVARRGNDVQFLGRLDRQLKLNGQLVSPEEVEAAIAESQGVREAVVLKRALGAREALVAFVAGEVAEMALRARLASRLPASMIPSRFVVLEELPRNASGKVDLDALRAMPVENASIDESTGVLQALFERVLGRNDVGADDDFFALGGDSMSAIELVAAAEARGIALSAAAIFEHRTIRGLLRFGGAPDAKRASALRADAAWSEDDRARFARSRSLSARSEYPELVFMTGATGFLGARLLDALLERSEARFECLVRAETEAEGRARIDRALAVHGLMLGARASRVRVVLGDLERAELGMERAERARIAEEADAIVHCAARVHVLAPYDALRAANVEGTRAVVRLAAEGRPKRLVFASTLSVFVSASPCPSVCREDDALEATELVHGGYAQSKWAAEHLVREAGLDDTVIVRLGLLTGDARLGVIPDRDLFALFCRGTAELGCVPASLDRGLALDVTPVDFAAAAMARIALDASPGTFHLASPKSLPALTLVEALRRFGVRVRTVSDAEWRDRLAHAAARTNGAAASLAMARAFGMGGRFERQRPLDLFQATGVRFSTDRADAILAREGLACPEPTPALLATYLAHVFRDRAHEEGSLA